MEAKTPSGPSMAANRSSPDTKTPAATAPGGLDHVTPRMHKTAKVDGSFWENQTTDEETATVAAPAPAPANTSMSKEERRRLRDELARQVAHLKLLQEEEEAAKTKTTAAT